MAERIAAVQGEHEPRPHGLRQCVARVPLGATRHEAERRQPGAVSQAGQMLYGLQGIGRQAGEFAAQEFCNIVGDALGADALRVPAPCVGFGIEHQQAVVPQGLHELHRKQRVAFGLLVEQLRQGFDGAAARAQRVGHELRQIVARERSHAQIEEPAFGIAQRLQSHGEPVRRQNLIVPVRADQQEMPHLRLQREPLDEFQRRRIQPLKIVDEQRQGVSGLCERLQEPLKNHVESVLGLLRREIGRRGLIADDEGELRHEVHHQLTVRPERLEQPPPPAIEVGAAQAQEPADQALEGVSHGWVWNVQLELIGLARREQAGGRGEPQLQFLHH